jgi:flagellar motility protein MotE (MotC chaperone)
MQKELESLRLDIAELTEKVRKLEKENEGYREWEEKAQNYISRMLHDGAALKFNRELERKNVDH